MSNRIIEITITAEPGTSYVLTNFNGNFNPPLPSVINSGRPVVTQCTSPARLEYNGSSAGVLFEITGDIVQHFNFSAMKSVNYQMLDEGARYQVGLTPSVS